jgi:hypothetical protein
MIGLGSVRVTVGTMRSTTRTVRLKYELVPSSSLAQLPDVSRAKWYTFF